jgi:hypothetical protein
VPFFAVRRSRDASFKLAEPRKTARKLDKPGGAGGVSLARDGETESVNGMPLRIRVRGSARAVDLLTYLRSVGADARREGDAITVRRRHPVIEGEPPMQDRMELEFVLREWATHRPGAAFEIEEAA